MIIKYSKNSIKFLSKLDKKSVMMIRDAINSLTLNPPIGDIKPMQGYADGRKRLRVGQWRVIYKVEEDFSLKVLLVLDIGNRGDIYK